VLQAVSRFLGGCVPGGAGTLSRHSAEQARQRYFVSTSRLPTTSGFPSTVLRERKA